MGRTSAAHYPVAVSTDPPGPSEAAPAHYFSASPASPARERLISVMLAGSEVEVCTDSGVFSSGRLDLGTRVLLHKVPPPPAQGQLLDLGCGWGPLALTMAMLAPQARVWAVDVNERALGLVRANAAKLAK